MTREEEARKLQHCARAACQRYIGTGGFKHRDLPWRYCISCARKINDGCPPDNKVFDLSGVRRDP